MNRFVLSAACAALLSTAPAFAAAPDAASHGSHAMAAASAPAVHATGVVRQVDAANGRVVVQHEAIPAIGWPPMTMGFRVADAGLLSSLTPGKKVRFAFVQQGANYVITSIE